MTYDNNGNLTAAGAFLSPDAHEYVYNAENRLIEVWQGLVRVAAYDYDAMGRRIQKTVGAVVTTYVYSGNQVLAEYENGVLTRKFIYGPGIDEPVAMIDLTGGNPVVYFYYYDGLGSVAALSNMNGQIAERYRYDAFGNTRIFNGSGGEITDPTEFLGNPYMFTGRRWDAETGLYYYRARIYNPALGRFMQTDPIGYYDSMNLYQYCGNNPVNRKDPTGKSVITWILKQAFGPSPLSFPADIGADTVCFNCGSLLLTGRRYCPDCGHALREYRKDGWYYMDSDPGPWHDENWQGPVGGGMYYYRPPYPPVKPDKTSESGKGKPELVPLTESYPVTDPSSLPAQNLGLPKPGNFKEWSEKNNLDYDGNSGTWYNYNPDTYQPYGPSIPVPTKRPKE